jgi:hypothetical protein
VQLGIILEKDSYVIKKIAIENKPYGGSNEWHTENEGYVSVGKFQPSQSVTVRTFIRKDGSLGN